MQYGEVWKFFTASIAFSLMNVYDYDVRFVWYIHTPQIHSLDLLDK
jgi:hypothetical protein